MIASWISLIFNCGNLFPQIILNKEVEGFSFDHLLICKIHSCY
ncbi:MAG: hypothetical protein HOG49_09990 [Candidatus Scalindua sp.]|nr:hypothetical protein [Candidatus Scalindua sp.]